MIFNKINNDIIASLKSGNKLKLSALRYLKSHIEKESKDKKSEATDNMCIQIAKRLIKQNQEASQFMTNTDKVELEIGIWLHYVPKMLSEEDTKVEIDDIIKTNDITSIKQMGLCMKLLKDKFGQSINMKIASAYVKSKLS